MLKIEFTSQFKRDYKAVKKRGCKPELLEEVMTELVAQRPLAAKYRDHSLSGKYQGMRECHILPDWLLVYQVDKGVRLLRMVRTGSHSDLF